MQFSSRDVVHLCCDTTDYFDIARVTWSSKVEERYLAISHKIYIHEYSRTRPLWYISSTIEGIRWIMCDGQRMRIMENRRTSWVHRDPPSKRECNVVSELPEIPRLVGMSWKLEKPRTFFLEVSSSSTFVAHVFPFAHTPEFFNPCGFNAMQRLAKREEDATKEKCQIKMTDNRLSGFQQFSKTIFSILPLFLRTKSKTIFYDYINRK